MAWSNWESLGGIITAGPAVSSWAGERLDTFVKGADNALWHKWFAGGWSDWESLGGIIDGSPAAVSWSSGRIDVFARGMDNALWHKWFDGGWHNWESLGGTITAGPAVSSWAPAASMCSPKAPTTRCGTGGSTAAGTAGNRSAASSTTNRRRRRGRPGASMSSRAAWTTRCGTNGSTAAGATGSHWAGRSPQDLRQARGRRDASMSSPRAPTTRCGTSGSTAAGAAGSHWVASSTTRRPPSRGASGRIDTFVRGMDNAMWHKWWTQTIPTVRLHVKVLSQPTRFTIDRMVDDMIDVYATYGIRVHRVSDESLSLPLLNDLDVGACTMGNVTTEQTQLMANRNGVATNDVVAYFVRSTNPALNGCAAHPANQPSAVVASIASEWTLGHEVGHVLGLPHVTPTDRLMMGSRNEQHHQSAAGPHRGRSADDEQQPFHAEPRLSDGRTQGDDNADQLFRTEGETRCRRAGLSGARRDGRRRHAALAQARRIARRIAGVEGSIACRHHGRCRKHRRRRVEIAPCARACRRRACVEPDAGQSTGRACGESACWTTRTSVSSSWRRAPRRVCPIPRWRRRASGRPSVW